MKITGRSSVDMNYISGPDGYEPQYYDIFYPGAAYPAPSVFPISEELPEPVIASLRNSFGILWINLASCLSELRRCVELILDEQKVPRTQKNKKKEIFLPLHDRLVEFSKINEDAAKSLMAIKWLGNSGTHAQGDVEYAVILDAFDILERAVEQIYSQKTKELESRISQINSKKGA